MSLLSLSIAMFGGLDIDLAALKTAENLRALCRRPGVQKIFLEDVMSIKSAIGEYGNPFLKSEATFSFSIYGTL